MGCGNTAVGDRRSSRHLATPLRRLEKETKEMRKATLADIMLGPPTQPEQTQTEAEDDLDDLPEEDEEQDFDEDPGRDLE